MAYLSLSLLAAGFASFASFASFLSAASAWARPTTSC